MSFSHASLLVVTLSATCLLFPAYAQTETQAEPGIQSNAGTDAQAQAQAQADTELIEAIIAHHMAASASLTSYSAEYEYRMEFDKKTGSEGEQHHDSTAKAKITRNGNFYWFWRHSLTDRPEHVAIELIETAVLNDKYFAICCIPVKANNSYEILNQIEHRGLDNMRQPPLLRMAPTFPSPEPAMFGFSRGIASLGAFYERHPDLSIWTIQKDEETNTFLLQRRLVIDAPTRSTRKYWISPAHGYLIQKMEVWDSTGTLERAYSCTFQKVTDDLWFPKSVISRIPGDGFTLEMILREITVNQEFEAAQYMIEKLPLDFEKTILKKHFTDGSSRDYRYIDGLYVPESSIKGH